MRLENLGWKPFFNKSLQNLRSSIGLPLHPARVVRQDRGALRVTDSEDEFPAHLAGTLLAAGEDGPATVGDWVALTHTDGTAVVRAILPRPSVIQRKSPGAATREQILATNVDRVLVVAGLETRVNLRRLERTVAMIWDTGAVPVVVLTKSDLCADPETALRNALDVVPGVAVVVLSAVVDPSLEELEPHLGAGTTVVLLGPSGAGKSTLVNRLLGENRQAVSHVRAKDLRGRHTTTRRELMVLPGGACVIDTPGLRELGMWSTPESVGQAFVDIASLAESCRFRNCSHHTEPGCAVSEAVESGTLDPRRLDSYHRLVREAEVLATRLDTGRRHEIRRRDRTFSRLVRAEKKRKAGK